MKVNLLLILRVFLYIQFSIGIGRLLGFLPGRGVFDIHLPLGVIVAILAIFALRPRPGQPASTLRQIARFLPLLPLAIGVALYLDWLDGLVIILIHAALGVLTIGLVEGAAAEERRRGS